MTYGTHLKGTIPKGHLQNTNDAECDQVRGVGSQVFTPAQLCDSALVSGIYGSERLLRLRGRFASTGRCLPQERRGQTGGPRPLPGYLQTHLAGTVFSALCCSSLISSCTCCGLVK